MLHSDSENLSSAMKNSSFTVKFKLCSVEVISAVKLCNKKVKLCSTEVMLCSVKFQCPMAGEVMLQVKRSSSIVRRSSFTAWSQALLCEGNAEVM